MNHSRIFSRAWEILKSYRALWVIGFLLALATTSTPSNGSSGNRNSGGGSGSTFPVPQAWQEQFRPLQAWFERTFAPDHLAALIPYFILAVVIILALVVLLAVVRYVAKAAAIRMVDGYEANGEKVTWRQGWRLGWNGPAAWRLFLTDLMVGLPVLLFFALMFGCVAAPVLPAIINQSEPGVGSIISVVGLLFIVIFLLIIVALALSLLMELVYRYVVLADLGPVEAVRAGWRTLRARFKDVGLLWLMLVGLKIAFGLAMLVVTFLLIAGGLLVAGGLGAAMFFLAQALSGATAGWVAALIGGGLIFLVVLGLPLTFVRGLFQAYESSVWTLGYRELRATGA